MFKPAEKMVVVAVRLPPKEREKIAALSKENGISESAAIREIIQHFFSVKSKHNVDLTEVSN